MIIEYIPSRVLTSMCLFDAFGKDEVEATDDGLDSYVVFDGRGFEQTEEQIFENRETLLSSGDLLSGREADGPEAAYVLRGVGASKECCETAVEK